jgi:hypothetical protein
MATTQTSTSTGRTIKTALDTPAGRPKRRRETALATAPETGKETPDQTGAVGVPGNLNMSGFLTSEDYNPDLDGYPAYRFYDEMRRGDAQVNATLLMCKLPIKAARRKIEPASEDPQDQAIAAFVQAALLDDDAMETTWSDVLDNALLKLDFGSSAHEKIWMVDELGALRFQRLAPRLPKTFYRWVEDATGMLTHLQQFAPKGGAYGFFDIEVDRLILHVNNREGNNWYGRSLLRAAYPNWFWKQQFYRIAAIGADRELVGIPRAKLTTEYNAQVASMNAIETTLKGMRSYDRGYIVQPPGVEFEWMRSDGSESRIQALLSLVEHHNVMIARNILQGFAAQGEQAHGSFGAAAVTFEAFYDALVALDTEINAEFKQQAIKPLCEKNFDMTGRKTPKMVTEALGNLDAGRISTNLAALSTAKVITPDDSLEDFVRQLNGAPPLPEDMRGRSRSVAVPGFPPVPAPATPADDPDDDPTPDPAPKTTTGEDPEDEPIGTVDAARGFEELGRRFSREPSEQERAILDLHAIPRRLDDERDRLARTLGEIRQDRLRQLVAIIVKKDARPTAAFTDLRKSQLPKPNSAKLRQAIRAAQLRVMEYGQEQVREELGRQDVAASVELANGAGQSKKAATSAMVASAEVSADRLASEWDSTILQVSIRKRRAGLVGDALELAIKAELDELALTGAKRIAGEEVNEAFGVGRDLEARAQQELGNTEKALYSAILDANTCPSCYELDGQEFLVGSDEYELNAPPNRNCDGRDSCRCVYMFFASTPN